jgi:hypothetical protein
MHRERFDWRNARLRHLKPVAAEDVRLYAKRLGVLEWMQ